MKIKSRPIELLAPAKNFLCGIEAVNHGADAVYIGAPKFSARAAAGNSIEDIHQLCEYAHLFGVRVYIALNTILKEEELRETEEMIHSLYKAGVDALIIQDMGITQLNIPPIPLHASTQTDNRTPEKVKFLENAGFTQVVLARELSLNQIRQIADHTNVPLEVFVHGALCVSYSGQCYLSAALSGRSANRGECAQYCRLPYRMIDAAGKEITSEKHLLSLKDLNRSDQLEALLDAGVSSLKIEGRLKDISYVKNITAYYRKKLDAILERRSEYHRASAGRSSYTFEPVPEKSFNRGFTSYFLNRREQEISSFDSPKSLGEPVGTVKEIKGRSFTVAGLKKLNNGDGLVFFNAKGQLEGFRVNRIENNQVYPLEMPAVKPKMTLYRNYDQAFEKLLDKPSAERKLNVRINFSETPSGFMLEIEEESGARIIITEPFTKEIARTEQQEQIRNQLSKLGNTIFQPTEINLSFSHNWFVPASLLAKMRREAIEKLYTNKKVRYQQLISVRKDPKEGVLFPQKQLTYLANISNPQAETFYRKYGVQQISPAYENQSVEDIPLMFTKHCLRYSFGWCPVMQKKDSPYREPFYLIYKDVRLKLGFDCKNCQMLVFSSSQRS